MPTYIPSGNYTVKTLTKALISGNPTDMVGPVNDFSVSVNSSGNGGFTQVIFTAETFRMSGSFIFTFPGVVGSTRYDFPGGYFIAEYTTTTSLELRGYDLNDNLVYVTTQGGNNARYVTICEFINGDDSYYGFAVYRYDGDVYLNKYFYRDIQGLTLELSSILTGIIPPDYTWTAWDQISGNSGQYRCSLSTIENSMLVDLDIGKISTAADFSRISSQSSIWSIAQNMSLDSERVIAYSGVNWLTLTLSESGVAGNYDFTFKFYAPAISETTPFYTLTKNVIWSGTNPMSNVYLAFAHDDENYAALFLPILYKPDGVDQGYWWGSVSGSDDEMLYLWQWLQASGAGTPEYPYDTGSTDDGGNPSGATPGDHLPAQGVPTLGALQTGMFTVYCPTDEQLEDIADYLWSDNVITNITKYFTNFSDNIIALYVLPFKPSNLPTKAFKVGNMESGDITAVEYLTSRFMTIDMGSVYIENVFDSYLDYAPYTKIECYLPGVGIVALDVDDIMCPTDPDTGTLTDTTGSTISLKYNIDLMTGILVAFIYVNNEMRYQFSGKVGYSIPLTGENYTSMVTGFVTAAAGLVGTVATGGLSAPIAAGGVSAAISGTVNAMKPDIHRGGNLSGDASMLSYNTPYIIYHRPNKPLLANQENYTGFPSYKSGTLSEFSGLTNVIDAHIEGISCTEQERAEILSLLKSGVIL